MTLNDPLANALTTLQNADLRRRRECLISPASNLIGHVLKILQQSGYIGEFEFIDDGKAGFFKVQLIGRINKCRAVKPRFPASHREIEKFEKMFLPAYNVGVLVISTPRGLMTHVEAKKNKVGGRLIAYVY
ncbi:MAG: 30S ribosomal protein S8 [Thermoproteota archaeon]